MFFKKIFFYSSRLEDNASYRIISLGKVVGDIEILCGVGCPHCLIIVGQLD